MPSWDPNQYLKFTDHRLRPALDLMAQIALEAPRSIYDLGCGPGTITRLLAERWPEAAVTGVDSSADMLAKARQEAPSVAFEQADIARWSPPAPADLLFTNATLHWLDDHAALLPRLAAQLAPGGVLAIQMPDNRQSPSHLLMDEAAAAGPWHTKLARLRPVYGSMQSADAYYRILAPVTRQLDIWETTYLHVLRVGAATTRWWNGPRAPRCAPISTRSPSRSAAPSSPPTPPASPPPTPSNPTAAPCCRSSAFSSSRCD